MTLYEFSSRPSSAPAAHCVLLDAASILVLLRKARLYALGLLNMVAGPRQAVAVAARRRADRARRAARRHEAPRLRAPRRERVEPHLQRRPEGDRALQARGRARPRGGAIPPRRPGVHLPRRAADDAGPRAGPGRRGAPPRTARGPHGGARARDAPRRRDGAADVRRRVVEPAARGADGGAGLPAPPPGRRGRPRALLPPGDLEQRRRRRARARGRGAGAAARARAAPRSGPLRRRGQLGDQAPAGRRPAAPRGLLRLRARGGRGLRRRRRPQPLVPVLLRRCLPSDAAHIARVAKIRNGGVVACDLESRLLPSGVPVFSIPPASVAEIPGRKRRAPAARPLVGVPQAARAGRAAAHRRAPGEVRRPLADPAREGARPGVAAPSSRCDEGAGRLEGGRSFAS